MLAPSAAHDAAVKLVAASHGPEAATFARAFLSTGAPDDLASFDPETLAGFVRIGLAAAAAHGAGESRVAATLPDPGRDGFAFDGSVLAAVNDDKPFLFDSIMGEVVARGLEIAVAFHPIWPAASGARISVIVIAIAKLRDALALADLEAGARAVFADVSAAVADWPAMRERIAESCAELKRRPPPIDPAQLAETIAFLKWLDDGHFTFLGCRDYVFDEAKGLHEPSPDSGLGVLRDPSARIIRRPEDPASLTPEVLGFLTDPDPLIVTKSNMISRVHRRVAQDYVGCKRFDGAGRLAGERRFVGLFTSSAYHQLPSDIPLLRRKAARAVERAGFDPRSHDGKSLANVIETYPRDELFQIGEDELLSTALGIMHLNERPRVKSFFRVDRFERSVSALIFMPRDRYSGAVRVRIGEILAEAYGGEVALSAPTFGEAPVARLHVIVRRHPGPRPAVEEAALAAEIEAATRTWADSLAEALAASDLPDADALGGRYADAFPAAYREQQSLPDAVADVARLEALAAGGLEAGRAAFHAMRDPSDGPQELRLRLLRAGGPAELSSVLPLLEAMGLVVAEELNYRIRPKGAAAPIALHVFRMRTKRPQPLDLAVVREAFEDAMRAVWAGEAESDGLNQLTLAAGLPWRAVAGLRACVRYLRQAGIAFSQAYMEDALARNADVAALVVKLFAVKFDPAWGKGVEERRSAAAAVSRKIDAALADVKSLDDDRILRRVRNVAEACVRTNLFRRDADGRDRPALAFKLDARRVEGLPAPVPFAEIFVYSPRVEGVHLRFGKVARGGIRWSDRREDFRTEILGLVKAQQVKNAVIVPVGAKGGFFPKRLPENAAREAVQAEGVAAYEIYVNALLDVTDTIAADGAIAAPPDVVRHDGDDPYLVVAADKGTATFSDRANAISSARGFWLDDAFASGGSAGYDHKAMGITARGAWEAVKRHFREMGVDCQTQAFTTIGVGDMSGDVFGNGMLLSRATKLVAAFDHRDVFIDPSPDPERSWAERQRLFGLPRSSWQDYDRSLISKGGGVFSRSTKAIPLSDEMKALTGLDGATATPQELMHALLKAPCDLLWFGGIGTYVKASGQSHADAGDRANDAIRVDGRELRAKVVGEGANLGCTQAGRIEAAQAGVRLNTDAIDNSAGVDTSDHEVNLKILFQAASAAGAIDRPARDALLESMTDEVAALVLQDNYRQTLALSVAEAAAADEIEAQGRFMRGLEARGLLDRKVETLPSDAELKARRAAGLGLTRPELAVLLAYSKIALNQALLDSDVPDDPGFAEDLAAYFPGPARERFAPFVASHRLRRELVATVVCNDVVNRTGPAFVHGVAEASGAGLAQVARAVELATSAFRLDALYAAINALDGRVPAATQIAMHRDAIDLLERQTHWMLRNVAADAPFAPTAEAYRTGIDALKGTFSTLVSDVEREAVEARIASLAAAGVPAALADEAGALPLLATTTDIVALAKATSAPLDAVAGAYFEAGAALGVDRLRAQARLVKPSGHWDGLSLARIEDDLFAIQRLAAGHGLKRLHDWAGAKRREGAGAVRAWAEANADRIGRARTLIAELEKDGAFTAAKLALGVAQLRDAAT